MLRSAAAVVVAGAQQTGSKREIGGQWFGVGQAELREVERDILVGDADDPNEVIDHL